MTEQQLERIAEFRHLNYSYSFIGEALDLSLNTVKSTCRRKGFSAEGCRKTKAEKRSVRLCKNCRRILTEDGRIDRKFCSDACRYEWWKNNRKVIENK